MISPPDDVVVTPPKRARGARSVAAGAGAGATPDPVPHRPLLPVSLQRRDHLPVNEMTDDLLPAGREDGAPTVRWGGGREQR